LALVSLGRPAPAAGQTTEESAEPRPIELQDIFDWKRIAGSNLSKDGTWFAYSLSPGEGNSELVVRSTADATEHRFPVGERGGAVSFSDDSRWLAFAITPTKEESDRPRGQGSPARNKVGLLELASGEMTEVEDVQSFAFAGERGGWIALRKYPPSGGSGGGGGASSGGGPGAQRGAPGGGGDDRDRGVDLILHDLSTGARLNIGNVSEFEFDESGRWLVWAVDAEGKAGNGIQLRDMETGVIQVLESDDARYSRLAWTDDETALIALKGVDDDDYEDPLYSVVGWTGFEARNGPEKVVFDPAEAEGFPEGMTVSPNQAPRWSEDRDAIFFGIHEVEMKESAEEEDEEEEAEEEEAEGEEEDRPTRPDSDEVDDDEKPGLVIWHWKDPRLQRMQELQASRDRNFSYLSVFWTESGRFVRLADDAVENVMPARTGPWAVGMDNTAYELMGNLDGRRYQDVFAVDMRTGEREMILERARWTNDISPDGGNYLYYQDGHYHTYEFASGQHRNITAEIPTSFINTENDQNQVDPPIRPQGWTEDGGFALLYDNWDIWQVPVHGGEAVNLTVNGKTDQVRYQRITQFDPDNEPGIDLSEPVYFRTYGEWTKKSGYSLMTRGRPGPEVLAWDDVAYGAFMKAEDAETYLISWSTNEIYPDYHVTDARLGNPQQITDGFPEQSNFLWTDGAILVDYESDKGDRLQGALYLPADYQEGQSYPTIVYFYEKLSQGLNNYTFPSANGFNKSVYTSNGYAVFMPDIVYRINDPGMSAVWCVLPGLQAAIETGVVDPERVGMHGHSWGGYQSSFLITQTNAFAAVATGAPLTNMISMYGSIYWNSGSADGAIFESSQGRFYGGPWDHLEAYARNSPVYHAKNIETPILLLHNDADGAVDWNQGVEFYNTVRRLQKPIVMLQYVGENHGVSKPQNRKDYTVRMREFFNHYLKNEPAPGWWTEGVPHLEMDDHIKERIHLVRPPEKENGKGKEGKPGGR
jgi:dipeptidyl aminopeptidase/acylaminoacyl peptidase